MAALLKTTAGALLWPIESLQSMHPIQTQSDIASQLTATLQVTDTNTAEDPAPSRCCFLLAY